MLRGDRSTGQQRGFILSARIFCALVLCHLVPCCSGWSDEPGQLVVAAQDVQLREQSKVIDTVAAGQVLRVLATRDANLWVSRGKPGWIPKKHTIPLAVAEDVFSSAIESDPTPQAYVARGNVRTAKGDHAGALEDIRSAMKRADEPDDYYEPLAYALLASGQLSEAARTFQRILESKPNNASALMGRGVANYQLGNFEAAQTDLSKSIQVDPQHAFPRKYLGALYYDLANLEAAKNELDVAAQLDAFDPMTRKIRGQLLFELEQYDAALTDYEVALRVKATDIEALTGHGIVTHAIGHDLDRALADFTKAVQLGTASKDNAYLWSNLGQVQMDLGDAAAAYQNLTRAIQLDPTFNEARSHRAFLIANLDKPETDKLNQAKDDVRAVFASNQDKSYWDYRALAAVNAALGHFERASKYQQQAIAIVRRTGPQRFVDVAMEEKLRYDGR